MAIDTSEIYKKMATLASSPQSTAALKKKALEEALGLAASQQASALNQARQQGIGTSGASLLAGTRARESGQQAAAQAMKDIDLEQQEKEYSRLGQLASLGQSEKSLALQETAQKNQFELQKEDMALKKASFEQQKDNDLWNRSQTTKNADRQYELAMTQLQNAWTQYQQGRIDAQQLQEQQNQFTKDMARLNAGISAEAQAAQNVWQSTDNAQQRSNAYDMMKYQADIQKKISDAQINASEPEWYESMFAGMGAVGSLMGGVAKAAG